MRFQDSGRPKFHTGYICVCRFNAT